MDIYGSAPMKDSPASMATTSWSSTKKMDRSPATASRRFGLRTTVALWIGTPGGLTLYRADKFTTYTKQDGLADSFINSITEDRSGALWIAAGIYLSRYQNGKFTNFSTREGLPIESMRAVYLGRDGTLYLAGYAGVAKREGNRFVPVIGPAEMGRDIVSTLTEDRHGNLWVAGNFGLWMRSRDGKLRLFQTKDGLPDNFVRSVWEDRDGNLWAGTNGGLARLENGRFVSNPLANSAERDWVRCIYEDVQGNLWVGMNSGLNRLRDDMFAIYGRVGGPAERRTHHRVSGSQRTNLDRVS